MTGIQLIGKTNKTGESPGLLRVCSGHKCINTETRTFSTTRDKRMGVSSLLVHREWTEESLRLDSTALTKIFTVPISQQELGLPLQHRDLTLH